MAYSVRIYVRPGGVIYVPWTLIGYKTGESEGLSQRGCKQIISEGEEKKSMKMHIEYDDFGEYLEAYVDDQLLVMEEYYSERSAELIIFEGAGVA